VVYENKNGETEVTATWCFVVSTVFGETQILQKFL
jgi:hypothetical protein